MGKPLATERVQCHGSEPLRWHFVLHGILGRRMNWRRFCQKLCERRPQDGFILIDLPEHGESPDSLPPHSIARTAQALLLLESALGHSIYGGLGHSFGGKVLTEWATQSPSRPTELWLIDSNPIARPAGKGSTLARKLIEQLELLPRVHDDRRSFVSAIRNFGYAQTLAQWLSMNLERQPDDRLIFRPNLAHIQALMLDYFRYDGWATIDAPNPNRRWNLVIAGQSSNYLSEDRDRALAAARSAPHIAAHLIESSGHWVHIDAPDTLLKLMG